MTSLPPTFAGALKHASSALFLAFAPAAFAALVALQPAPARAQATFANGLVEAEILPGWRTPQGHWMAALHLRFTEGWHTYWRIPGEAGIPPQMDWTRSQNVAAITPVWPRPQVFVVSGYLSYGYENELVLPLEITPDHAGRPAAVFGDITIGVCRDTCVPVDLTVSAALRGDGARDPRIVAALASQPDSAATAGLTRTTCRLEPGEGGARLTLRASMPRLGADEQVIVELPGTGYWVSDSRTWREGGDLVAQARIRDPQRGPVSVNRQALAFSVLAGARMVESQGCVGG